MMDTYMAAFNVFVEGATDATPAGLQKLAASIAGHYGLPAADLLARLQKGRFRVKGNIERAMAESYVRDLTKLGARCVIEDANADAFGGATPIPFPAPKPEAVAPTRPTPPPSALPPRATPTPSTPPSALPPRTGGPSMPPPSALPPRAGGPSIPPANSGQFQSGLAAAFTGDTPSADLGALGREDAPFSLSTVDGADEGTPDSGGSYGPPGGGMPASIGPAPEAKKDKAGKAAKPKDEPLDMFAPPELQGDEFKVEVAADEIAISRTKTPLPPPAAEPEPPARTSSPKIPTTPATARISKPSLQAPNVPVDVALPSSNKFGALGEPRVRFAAGIFLAIIIGFVPAHVVAKMREDAAFATVDKKVIVAQQTADTLDTWKALDSLRADQLARKEAEKRNAAIIGFVVWALVGAGVGWAFFKKVPWDA